MEQGMRPVDADQGAVGYVERLCFALTAGSRFGERDGVACQFPLCPVGDRGCVAAQYVAKAHKRS
jgi:hypothetical protein